MMKFFHSQIKKTGWLVAVVILSLLSVSQSCAENVLKINTLKLDYYDGQTTLVFDLEGPAEVEYFYLSEPSRFVIDLYGVVRKGDEIKASYKNTPIKKIYSSDMSMSQKLRMVLELDQNVSGRAHTLLSNGDQKRYKLVVDLWENGIEGAVSQRVQDTHYESHLLTN